MNPALLALGLLVDGRPLTRSISFSHSRMDIYDGPLFKGITGGYRMPMFGDLWAGPLKHEPSVNWRKIDASMGACTSKVVVPVRTVQSVAALKVHNPGNITQFKFFISHI